MTAELGHMAIILAFMLSLAGAFAGLYGAGRNHTRLILLTGPVALSLFALTALAFGLLTLAFVQSDFSLAIVVSHSHTLKPLLYKISGVWGNHEGSLLLWVLILTLFAASVAAFGRNLPDRFKARVLAVQMLIAAGFYAFMLFTSNPFARVVPAPAEGNGLNPILQDPGLAFHPPFLYLGYVGFSIAFSFAIAALLEKRVSPLWARWVRPWTLAAWSFLTIGIALGSWWAYYELGWGGFWFWDPVENASFMPWLAGTALVHSVVVLEKRDVLKAWTILLAILTFSLSLLGTFLVRSGVLTSVHAFATDPARGVFILAFLIAVIGGSLALFAMRAGALRPGSRFEPVSREGALILNNFLLVVALATVLLGTLYPLFMDALFAAKLSVGPPYYNATFVPLMVPLVLAMGAGPLLSWKRADLANVTGLGRIPLILAGTAGIGIWALIDGAGALAALGIGMGLWLLLATGRELMVRAGLPGRSPAQGLRRLAGLPRAAWGMTLAHAGMAVTIIGITVAGAFTTERLEILSPGESVEAGPYTYVFEGVAPAAGPNYTAIEGRFTVLRDGQFVAELTPQNRSYWAPPMQTTEAGIETQAAGDLYAVIGTAAEGGRWSMRLYFKPLVTWIWAGAVLMMLGGLLSLSDRRLPRKRKAPQAARLAAAG